MNEFSVVLFLIVSIFAFDAVCMDPFDLDLPPPPAPANVEFGECFAVSEMRSSALTAQFYEYHHICPKKLPDGSEAPQGRKVWYAVGSLTAIGSLVSIMDGYDYVEIDQSLMKFTFLEKREVVFVIGTTNLEFKITFQSLEESQEFYAIVYEDVKLSQTASGFRIGLLHEMMATEYRKVGDNVEALHEDINGTVYLTFKNGERKPLLIFSRKEAKITRSNHSPSTKLQLLLRVKETDYILTFANRPETRLFSDSLFVYLQPLKLQRLSQETRNRFANSGIAIEPQPVET